MGDLRHVPSGLGRLSSQSTIYGPDNACLLPTTATGSDCEAWVDPDITGTGTGPTTSESTPPAHATRCHPARYIPQCPMWDRWSRERRAAGDIGELCRVCSALFFMCEATSLFLLALV